MTKKNRKSIKSLLSFLLVVPVVIHFINNIGLLIKSEAQNSIRNAIILMLLFLFIASLITTTWICLLSILFIYFISLHMSWILSLVIILCLNLVVMLILFLFALTVKRKIGFPETNKLLRAIIKK